MMGKMTVVDERDSFLALKQYYTILRNNSLREMKNIIESSEETNEEELVMHAERLTMAELVLEKMDKKFEVVK